MRGQPTTFWAKLERDDQGIVSTWHPLRDHCADVAVVVETLLRLPLWRNRLSRLAGLVDLDEITRARLCVLAALHDVGKFNLGFQAKGLPALGQPAGHVTPALAAVTEGYLNKRLASLAPWGPGTLGLLVTSICHHGRPFGARFDAGSCREPFRRSFWSPRLGFNPANGIDALLTTCQDWFPQAFTDDGPALPTAPAFEHAFAGLVMLADWLGSNVDYFPFTEQGDPDRIAASRERAERIAHKMWLSVGLGMRSPDGPEVDPFDRISAFTPTDAQRAVCSLHNSGGGSIAVFESETGSGKTEAALAHFVRLFTQTQVDGLYFALPTRTSATQMFERVRHAVRRAFTQPPPVALAVPGYLKIDEVSGSRLPDFRVQWPDVDRFRYRAWAVEHPKRYMAGAVVVGTIDQVLLSSLMVGHAHLRATALLRHLLVVDEVHASDAYMTRILEDVLDRHLEAGGHALLLSATLGGETRSRLLAPMKRAAQPPLDLAVRTPYPLVSLHDSGGQDMALAVRNEGPRRSVKIVTQPWMETPEQLVAHAGDAASHGAKVLVVKNTVRDCVETQQALEAVVDPTLLFTCAGKAAPHHSRFARADRESLDRALARHLGKKRAAGGCVVIATQTVQQSLDIDADLLITDLCPADVLLQRIGRLHRHRRDGRPAGYDQPQTIVVIPHDRDLGTLLDNRGRARHHHGLGSVYSDLRILEATWQLVERYPLWDIPEMNRMLVEQSVHTEALDDITAEKGGPWREHAAQSIGVARGETRQAELNIIDRAIHYSETTFPDTVDQRITTRLGAGDRRMNFEPPVEGPFGTLVHQLDLRASWAAGVPDQTHTPDTVQSADGVTRFHCGGRAFIYDQHGLRPIPSSRADDTIA